MDIAAKDSKQDEPQQPDQKALTKREKLQAYNQAYYLQHRQEKRVRNRLYHQLNRKKINAQRRKRYHQHPTPFLTATQEWVAKNRVRRKATQQAWYQKHRERELAKRRAYYAAHREDERTKDRAAYKRKKEAALRALLDGL
jgi:hypothetical protein